MVHVRRAFLAAATLGLLVLAGCGDAGPHESIGSTSSAIFPNDQTAFDYFRGKGLTSAQAAGIVGNLDQESGVDPTAVEAGGPGRGIAQWSVGGRWDTDTDDNATWYAQMQGQSLDSLTLQLDFIWYELTTFSGYGLASLKASTNVTDATVAFETDFEGCGTCDQSTRISYAEGVLAAYGADSVDAGTVSDDATSGVDAGTPCTVTTTGMSGVCMDTTACAALGNVSTPGYCPGPDDIQCCTGTGKPVDDDAGTSSHGTDDAGTSSHGENDAGVTPPPHAEDAGVKVVTKPDSGGHGDVIDASMPSHAASSGKTVADGGGDADAEADASQAGGCTTSPRGTHGGGIWLAAIAWAVARRRKRD